MSYGDSVVFTYKGENYEIPHNKTLFALQRMMKEDESKGEPRLDLSLLAKGDYFEMSLALYRALTFAGAKIDDPMEAYHALTSDDGEELGKSLGYLIGKMTAPSDLKVAKKKPATTTKTTKGKAKPQSK